MPIKTLIASTPTAWSDVLSASPVVVLYKHSPTCGLSDIAMHEVRRFAAEHPAIPIHVVDVLSQRSVSNHMETTLGIRHESPQAIVFASGDAVWHGSHRQITADRLADAVRDAAHSEPASGNH